MVQAMHWSGHGAPWGDLLPLRMARFVLRCLYPATAFCWRAWIGGGAAPALDRSQNSVAELLCSGGRQHLVLYTPCVQNDRRRPPASAPPGWDVVAGVMLAPGNLSRVLELQVALGRALAGHSSTDGWDCAVANDALPDVCALLMNALATREAPPGTRPVQLLFALLASCSSVLEVLSGRPPVHTLVPGRPTDWIGCGHWTLGSFWRSWSLRRENGLLLRLPGLAAHLPRQQRWHLTGYAWSGPPGARRHMKGEHLLAFGRQSRSSITRYGTNWKTGRNNSWNGPDALATAKQACIKAGAIYNWGSSLCWSRSPRSRLPMDSRMARSPCRMVKGINSHDIGVGVARFRGILAQCLRQRVTCRTVKGIRQRGS